MSAKADLKHSVALFSIAVGACALIMAVVTAGVAVTSGPAGFLGCTAVAGLFGWFQLRRGLRLRNKAVAEGASVFEGDLGLGPDTGRTTRTGTGLPSFLDKNKKKDGDPPG